MHVSTIKQMEQYARENSGVISLSQGIPYMGSDPSIRDEVVYSIMQNKVDAYSDPQGLVELRDAISQKLQKDEKRYSPHEILITTGAVEAMAATLLAITTPGDEVIIPTPTYVSFFQITKTASLRAITLPLQEDKNWTLDCDLLESIITAKTKAIILCNPNNPTGSIYDKKTLLAITELAEKYNFFIIIDEVYKNMLYEDSKMYSITTDNKFKERIITIVSFSKDFSLTGWRVGFLYTSSALINMILPVHDTLVNCAPVISQYAALAALKDDERIIAAHLDAYREQRNIVESYLQKLTEYISWYKPQGSYFFFPKLLIQKDDSQFCLDLLQKQKLAIVPGSAFGPGGEGHVRICFGRNKADIIKGMERFVAYCNAL
jgi:aspartate/methionine/tyrosine aminotransferase